MISHVEVQSPRVARRGAWFLLAGAAACTSAYGAGTSAADDAGAPDAGGGDPVAESGGDDAASEADVGAGPFCSHAKVLLGAEAAFDADLTDVWPAGGVEITVGAFSQVFGAAHSRVHVDDVTLEATP